jgi:uncharacterized protein (TIGR02266 family)
LPDAFERRSDIQRRLTRRVGVCLGVGFRSESSSFTGFTSDISEGGLFVATHELQALGSEIELTFTLPAGSELIARGIVRWVRDPLDYNPHSPPGMGVQFTALGDQIRVLIHEFVELREPMFFEG